MLKKIFLLVAIFLANGLFSLDRYVYAQKNWFSPLFAIQQTYDDNIFLTNDDTESDLVTKVSTGFVVDPPLAKHKFNLSYYGDLYFFATHDGENTYNHTLDSFVELNFNRTIFSFANIFRYYSERLDSEDVNRIPRVQDHLQADFSLNLNKLTLTLIYLYKLENYKTDTSIGTFQGQSLTYKDLERDEYVGEIETAFKLWPKTSLLMSSAYGTIKHDTNKKSDSDSFKVLMGLRGQLSAKCTVEAKIGYQNQDYEDFSNDFENVIFTGSLVEQFTVRDTLNLNFSRTTNDTIYLDNAYYENILVSTNFKHSFTDGISGDINLSYQLNSYPMETTEADKTAKREDSIWSGGIGISCQLFKMFTANFKYEYKTRKSNFATFDYQNNLITIGLSGSF
jgi:hypothetical protein